MSDFPAGRFPVAAGKWPQAAGRLPAACCRLLDTCRASFFPPKDLSWRDSPRKYFVIAMELVEPGKALPGVVWYGMVWYGLLSPNVAHWTRLGRLPRLM